MARILYLLLTTGAGQKTLGEEYCSLLQVDPSAKTLPGLLKRIVVSAAPVLQALGVSTSAAKILSAVASLYLSLFYLGKAESYHPVKGVAGLRYIFHPRRPPVSAGNQPYRRMYRAVGVVGLLVGLFGLQKSLREWVEQRRARAELVSDAKLSPAAMCTLCLLKRSNSTRLSCGHLFCWECICQWLNHREQCPLCRHPSSHSDLLLLTNL